MSKSFTIGRLARTADVPTSTLRYYERIGLLKPDERSAGNYRLYGDDTLARLKFIRVAQANGFTLEDISQLLQFQENDAVPCNEVQSLIERRMTDLEERIVEMRRLRKTLKSMLDLCTTSNDGDNCRAVQRIKHSAADHNS